MGVVTQSGIGVNRTQAEMICAHTNVAAIGCSTNCHLLTSVHLFWNLYWSSILTFFLVLGKLIAMFPQRLGSPTVNKNGVEQTCVVLLSSCADTKAAICWPQFLLYCLWNSNVRWCAQSALLRKLHGLPNTPCYAHHSCQWLFQPLTSNSRTRRGSQNDFFTGTLVVCPRWRESEWERERESKRASVFWLKRRKNHPGSCWNTRCTIFFSSALW